MLYPAVHLRSSLSLPHDMVKPCLLTTTFTTAAFDRSSLWLFGASPCRATPRGLPSSFVQHEAHASSWHKLSVLAYNLGNLWRRLVLPKRIENWSLTSLQQRLVKTGGRLIKHARYYWLLLAESHLTRRLFGGMLRRIAALPSPAE